jgi:histidinol-phosphate/aromatic aminotransferase/cobyric acid decarboxylase-like protein
VQKIDLSFTTIKQELPDFIYDGLSSFAKVSNSYHHQPDELRQRIANKYQVPLDHIYLTAGADQAILLLSMIYGRHAHIFTPTYISYTDVRRVGGELTEHPALNELSYDVSTAKIENASLIFLANPNNPAGITAKDEVLELAVNNPDAKIVVDEAYGDFVNESVIDSVSSYKNLIVIRSFSKGYALAGYRIGFMIASPEIFKQLSLESNWFNVAYTSVGAAIAAMDQEDYFQGIRQAIVIERQLTEEFLTKQNYMIIPSSINAVLVKFASKNEASNFVEKLKESGVIVNLGNGASNCGLDNTFVRVSIGTKDQMQVFRDVVAVI